MLTSSQRAAHKAQTPLVIWFTGVSGAGKSTIAALVEQALHAQGKHTYTLDADIARGGLNRDLGFTKGDRQENVRRLAECARLMVDAGLIVLVTSISPYASSRHAARDLFAPEQFIEVFVDTPIAVAQQRDPKGLYARFAQGQISQLSGLDAPYERPAQAELWLDTTQLDASQCAQRVLAHVVVGAI